MRREPEPFVGFFPGPAGEAGDLLRDLVEAIVDDHLHWRRNYFPGDPAFLPRPELRRLEWQHDELEGALRGLLALLRRSLPFHSPRYIAHQQSELSLPSLLGSLAGMLYNANNVTSESGNVTLELELAATSRLLEMLGFEPPPALPTKLDKKAIDDFEKAAQKDFAWCHLNSGGTSANIEALWVARNVSYQTLAIAAACPELGIDLRVSPKMGAEPQPLIDLEPRQLLNLPPRVAVRLLPEFLARAGTIHAGAQALKDTGCHLDVLPVLMARHRPVLFVAGTAHYSIKKAADVLGIGADAVKHVDTDGRHRIDMAALRRAIDDLEPNEIPLAVIAIVGTTEEGAIDPVHEIVRYRQELEAEGISFWLHVDAAWGGYFRAMTRPSPRTELYLRGSAFAKSGRFEAPKVDSLDSRWFGRFVATAVGDGKFTEDHRRVIAAFSTAVTNHAWADALKVFKAASPTAEKGGSDGVSDESVRDHISYQLTEKVVLRVNRPEITELSFEATINPPDESVLRALQAIPEADSVTIDPHKMGYQHYPCGAVAFRDSRAWHYVYQRTPYLSSSRDTTPFEHGPMLAVERERDVAKLKTNVVGMYTLEGSRPSGPAAALWLSTTVMPLDDENHGRLVRASWLAAQELYAWLTNWERFEAEIAGTPAFQFVPLSVARGSFVPPDSNLVIFGVKPKADHTLAGYNRLCKAVYERFRISAEQGERRYSYEQPFFLSKTTFDPDAYRTEVMQPVADAIRIADFNDEYPSRRMWVLRAAVMNPYLYVLRKEDRSHLLGQLVESMATVAREALGSKPKAQE